MLYQMSIASDKLTESGLVFKVLDAETGEIYPIEGTVDFASDAIVPEDGIINPMQLHVRKPYFFGNHLLVSWSDSKEIVKLNMGMDENVDDKFSVATDMLASNKSAYIAGEKSDGTQVQLNTSVVRSSEVAAWQIMVKVASGESATLSWEGWNVSGYEAFFFADKKSGLLHTASSNGAITFENNTESEKSFTLDVTLAKQGYYTQLEFESGWNLFHVSFEPNADVTSVIMQHPVYTMRNNVYCRVEALVQNTGYWLHCEKPFALAIHGKNYTTFPESKGDWSITGVNVPTAYDGKAFQWGNGTFLPAKTMIPGRGYFIRKGN
jgi:hypothetical protein